jgi:ABC-type uncharacterized transport system substrate-binding protein
VARAQQTERMRRIGVLMAYGESDADGQADVEAFRQGLQKLGWTDGRNLRIDYRWAAVNAEAMERFAKELIALQPDLILSQSTPTTATLLHQTHTVPIIFANVADPVGSGFVASFRGQAATSPASPLWRARWPASGGSFSRRLRRASPGLSSCSARQLRHMPNIT